MFLNHTLLTSTASKHTTFGPDAFTPEFVKAVQAAASDAPPVTYDGEAFICGEVTLRSQLPASKAIAATARNRWIAARVNEQGWQSSTCDVEEAQWSQSVHGRRVR